jgi:hypothetical protein
MKEQIQQKKKKTKKVFIGTFYGFNLNITVPNELITVDDEWFQKQWKQWIESEKRNAVEEYKNEVFLKDLKKKKKWYRIFTL